MNRLRKLKQTTALVLLVAILLAATVTSGYIHHKADEIGDIVGRTNGKLVGIALGSAKGVTVGIKEGSEAGAEEGMSAKDTTAEIKNGIESLGKLEVLAAGVSLTNNIKINDTYNTLRRYNADAVFSVDLMNTEISFSQDGAEVYITIPEPELEIYVDQNSTQKLAEIQKFSLSVSAEDGMVSYLNSMVQTINKVEEKITNYDALFAAAKDAAEKQVWQLAETICGNDYIVHIKFK